MRYASGRDGSISIVFVSVLTPYVDLPGVFSSIYAWTSASSIMKFESALFDYKHVFNPLRYFSGDSSPETLGLFETSLERSTDRNKSAVIQ